MAALKESSSRRDPLDVALRLLAALALVLLVALLGVLLFAVVALVDMGGRLGGLGDVEGLAQRAGASLEQATQRLADEFDPAHPPRGELRHDTEFDELRRISLDETIGTSGEYVLTLVGIEKREGASDPNHAQYAVVRRQLQTPRETRVLGVVIRVERGEQDYYLYKGESLRLGRAYYKVNWVSAEREEIALARYRNVDRLSVPLKLELD